MKNTILSAAALTLVASQAGWAGVSTMAGPYTGVISSVKSESTGTVTVKYRRPEQKAWETPPPMPMDGDCAFTWDSAKADSVDFDCKINLGTFSTDTHAKVAFMNIKSIQTFYDLVQHVKGTAKWDAATKTLTYSDRPDPKDDKRRDDGRASTASKSKDPICEESDSMACKAFYKTSLPMEGLVMNLTFGGDLSSYSGKMTMIQHGGSGMEKASTDIVADIKGTAAAK